MAFWICAGEYPKTSAFYYFQKTFRATEGSTLCLRACGDARYQLFLNGAFVCEGPCQGSEYVRYYETVETPLPLLEGENVICAKVFYPFESTFIAVYRGSRPAFWLDGEVRDASGATTPFVTDPSWSCHREDAVTFHQGLGGVHFSVCSFENVLGDSRLTEVPTKAIYAPNLSAGGYTPWGLREMYPMAPRPIPFMYEGEVRPFRVLRSGEDFIELDAGAYTTAIPSITFVAREGSNIRMMYAECYSKAVEGGSRKKHMRDGFQTEGSIAYGPAVDLLTATGREQHFSPFWYRAFRFVRLEFSKDAQFSLKSLTYRTTHYPLDADGNFICSNERYNEMWKISRNTVLCCMHEIYMDCPYYEQQQYDMDSALEVLFTFRMGSDTRMPKKVVTDLAHSQIFDGMLQANYPSTGVQIIPDFTLFWVLMLRDYLRYTADVSTVRGFLGTMDKALESFENLRDDVGMVGNSPYWHFVDWVPSWSRGVPTGGDEEPMTVASLMFAAALKAGAEICDHMGRNERAAEYRRRAEELIATVNRLCYDAEVGLYKNTTGHREYSQHTTLWAVLSGAVTGADAAALVDRTFRASVQVEKCTFSMNHYLFRALELSGRYCYAPELFDGWEKMLDMHCTSWCENPDDPRSECHGWSSAPIYEFSAMVLGVYPTEDGYETVRIQPYIHLSDLQWARGSVPTPKGIIAVDWEKRDGKFLLKVTLPEADTMRATVILPNGETHTLSQKEGTFVCSL